MTAITANNNPAPDSGENDREEPPPILKSWKNLYIIVLVNLVFWITLFTIFTWMFQ